MESHCHSPVMSSEPQDCLELCRNHPKKRWWPPENFLHLLNMGSVYHFRFIWLGSSIILCSSLTFSFCLLFGLMTNHWWPCCAQQRAGLLGTWLLMTPSPRVFRQLLIVRAEHLSLGKITCTSWPLQICALYESQVQAAVVVTALQLGYSQPYAGGGSGLLSTVNQTQWWYALKWDAEVGLML